MERFVTLIEERIGQWCATLPDDGLYGPMAYLMGLPAKRVRPAAVLMGCELFGGNPSDALDEALGIELFHNFTLMHDDIMDEAPLRRGRPTVHHRWNVNTAILSGDAMLVKAYECVGRRPDVLVLFNRYALQVCEGQQLDMDFERRDAVSLPEYEGMIRLKTAVLLACAFQVGALVAGAEREELERIGRFGEHLGLAFQLRDDLLDAFGDSDKVGKQRGGDLRAGKKTWLLISGLERSDAEGRSELREELAGAPLHRDVERMIATLAELGIPDAAREAIARHDEAALRELDAIRVPEERKHDLRRLATLLMERVH